MNESEQIPLIHSGHINRIITSQTDSITPEVLDGNRVEYKIPNPHRKVSWIVGFHPIDEVSFTPDSRKVFTLISEGIEDGIMHSKVELVAITQKKGSVYLEPVMITCTYKNAIPLIPTLGNEALFELTVRKIPGFEASHTLKLYLPYLDDAFGIETNNPIELTPGTHNLIRIINTSDGFHFEVRSKDSKHQNTTLSIATPGMTYRISIPVDLQLNAQLAQSIYTGDACVFKNITVSSREF